MGISLLSKDEAILQGSVKYFTGVTCRNNHIDYRYVSTGICYSCKRLQANRNYSNNTENYNKRNKRSAIKHKERVLKNKADWVDNNRSKVLSIKRKYRDNNRNALREKSRAYMRKQREVDYIRLSLNIKKSLWECLKEVGVPKEKSTFLLLGYTREDLIQHIDSLLTGDMSWENYGSYWHLDHKIPLSWFNKDNILDAWKLENLQPKYWRDNLSKNNRYIG